MRTHLLPLLLVISALAPSQAHARFEPVTCRNSFTQQQEISEGNKVALEIYKQQPILPENDPTTRYVQALGAKLVQFAPLAQGVQTQWPFNFHVVASPEINAFALPGGSVFVNLGTIQAAETEAQLAGVMAHEISHVVMRHSTCNLGKQQRKGLLYGLGAIGSALILGNSAAGNAAQMGIGSLQSIDFLHMSRDDEKQADLLGVNILANAGYDPRGLPQFFETIQAKYGKGGAQFLSDHPNPGNRQEYVNAEIATLQPVDQPIINTAAFRQAHTRAMTQVTLTADQVKAGTWRSSGNYAAQPGGYATRVSTPVTTSSQQSTTSSQPISTAAAMPRLSSAQLGINARLNKFQARSWSISTPPDWKPVASDATTITRATPVTLSPPNANGPAGTAYGVLIGITAQPGNGISTPADLAPATAATIQTFLTQDPTLTQSGTSTSIRVGNQPALATLLSGTSPVPLSGRQQTEQDWLITIARPDGDLSYLVFVSPQSDFNTLKPLFDRMLATFSPQ